MWEEHPEYQKHQAKMLGVLILLVWVLYVGHSIEEHDWDLLKSIIAFTGAFAAVVAAFPIGAWLIVKLIKKMGSSPDQKDDD